MTTRPTQSDARRAGAPGRPGRFLRRLVVRAKPGDKRRGILIAGGLVLPCALGRGGVVRAKREGDGGTPAGRMRLIQGFFRPDRMLRPATGLAIRPIRRNDGWCDDPASPAYNRAVTLPSPAGHERMWRDDRLYDLVIDLGWNRGPIRRGRGSAIFLHIAREGFKPTEGCVALTPGDARRLLPRLGPRTVLVVL